MSERPRNPDSKPRLSNTQSGVGARADSSYALTTDEDDVLAKVPDERAATFAAPSASGRAAIRHPFILVVTTAPRGACASLRHDESPDLRRPHDLVARRVQGIPANRERQR